MDEPNLHKLLEELHTEIEHTQSMDKKDQELLRDLGNDIRWLLERSEADQVQVRQSLLERLEESISYLEISHPTLTNTLTGILESLSNAGI